MAARKKTKDLGEAEGVAEARATKTRAKALDEIFDETAEDDAENAKLGVAARHVKACHLIVKELELGLRLARAATTPAGTIGHLIERVIAGGRDAIHEAQQAQAALGR